MNTAEIMDLAVGLACQTRMPEDCEIYASSERVRRILFGIDADAGMLLAARDLGYDLVIAHHSLGGKASLGIMKTAALRALPL